MKKLIIFLFIICYSPFGYASDISDTFSEKYKSLVPSENSSVGSDYLFKQIALGSEYTIRMLDQLNGNNEELKEKFDVMIEKFDILIEQNQKIIKLLEK
ncbi:MAG: hypothetical protein DRH93_13340 [Deltaproteobacteria bacterium]|nr:MAG: hypothetical protein DRH93_13340 [Deltaproteobacteria bacterium]